MNPIFFDYYRGVGTNMADSRRTTKLLFTCFVLVGISLLSTLAPVNSMAVKPLTLGSDGVPFTAQVCQCEVLIPMGSID